MGRNRRRHPNGNAAGTIDQQVRELAGKDPRLLVLFIVIRLKVHGVEVDVLEHVSGYRAELGLGVPHRGRGQAVNAAKVALPGDENVPHIPPLGHAGQRGIDGIITVRVIALHGLADDPGALARRCTGVQPQIAHRDQDPPLRGFEPIADIRQSAADNHGHRVVEIALLELVFDVQR